PARSQPAVPHPSDLLRRGQTRPLEDPHVLLDAGEGHLEGSGEVADRGVPAPQALENAAASAICQGRECRIERWRRLNHMVQYIEEEPGRQGPDRSLGRPDGCGRRSLASHPGLLVRWATVVRDEA